MTALPPHTRGSRVVVYICLVVIAASTFGVAVLQHLQGASVAQTADTSASLTHNAPVLIQARYAVGAEAIARQGGVSGPSGNAAQFIRMMQDVSARPVDKVRLSIVVAELRTPDDALDYLSQPDVVDAIASVPDDSPLLDDITTLRTIYSAPNADDAEVSDTQVDGLLDRHGWFGKLAMSLGLPNSDDTRGEVIRSARATVIVSMTLIGFAVLGVLFGALLLLIVLLLWLNGKFRLRYLGSLDDMGLKPTRDELSPASARSSKPSRCFSRASCSSIWPTACSALVKPRRCSCWSFRSS